MLNLYYCLLSTMKKKLSAQGKIEHIAQGFLPLLFLLTLPVVISAFSN